MVQTTYGDASLLDTITLPPMSEMKDSQDRKEPDEVCCIYKADKVLNNA